MWVLLHIRYYCELTGCCPSASPQIYFDPEDDFRKGHAISAGYVYFQYLISSTKCISHTWLIPRCLLACFLAAFVLRTRLSMLNKWRNDRLTSMSQHEKYEVETVVDAQAEIYDTDDRYVFMT